MALKFDDKTFFHIPKTGGNYTRAVIQQLPAKFGEFGHPHCAPKKYTENSFCIVRNPLEWYESFYRYRASNGWGKRSPKNKNDPSYAGYLLDRDCTASNFGQFIRLVIKSYPNGFLTSLYHLHADNCEYVLRTETLTRDLKLLFKKWNYVFPPNILITNATSKAIDTALSPQLTQKIKDIEKNCFQFDREKWSI